MQINIRPDATTKLWIVRKSQQENITPAAYARRVIAKAAAEEQREADLECIAELAAEHVAKRVLAKLEELTED